MTKKRNWVMWAICDRRGNPFRLYFTGYFAGIVKTIKFKNGSVKKVKVTEC